MTLSPEAQDLLFREARTANAFTDEPVTDEQVAGIYDLVKYGPTAMNTQPLRVLLVRGGEPRERLLEAHGRRQPRQDRRRAAGRRAGRRHRLPRAPGRTSRTSPAPATFRRRRRPRAGRAFNATLQVGYFLLGVRAAGLAAGPMGGFDAAGIDEEFFAGRHLKSLLVVNIGHPAENAWFDRLPRLEHDEVVITA